MILAALLLTSPLLGGDPSYFPIGVWLQSPANAPRYQAIGINLYVGLWQGPTGEQIAALEKAKMPVACEMNDWAKAHLDRKIIAGWMHQDEPDNAQPLPDGKGYGPPILPDQVVQGYARIRQTDSSRPVLLNLGQGVAWDDWFGRGVRTRHPEDYAAYAKGADIASFDIYPVTSPPPVQGNLWYVGQGTARLRKWTRPAQRVWACIEATRISNPATKPTPAQTKTLVWMALIHGAQGLIYFSHQFAPTFIEAGILADEEMSKAVKAINEQVQSLAPVLNSPDAQDVVKVAGGGSTVDVLVKKKGKELYIFAINMTSTPTQAEIFTPSRTNQTTVLDENRSVPLAKGAFTDHFSAYEVHLYKIKI
ncbi:hypothetical protein [Fimbriimonas ginsengisoli]|uniref:Glycoside hydrolase family 42 N-terminal domain-containing protein n=1 Tax=Fimbriimonas ginsengisoli Gsoil 348 TaxID=661478 RepID=A0A068NU69_FIMGI|nr:hypothetical protein [Fimbriimonas ginsengisoli]AIE86330.1 hypothetical protein OP10G_2962 [Fimbriimonas ginsengisoli Gsoil 348]